MINLDKSKKYLLACSYGTDSMVLFDILLKNGYDFSVAHVNYNLREESKEETASLKLICKQNNIPIYVHEIDQFLPSGNVESICRNIRYTFFKTIYDEYNFDALLIAHQQDDLLETYYLQLDRKGFTSHYGLSEERELFGMKVVRPMLHISKQQIDRHLIENNIPHSVDSSNLLDCYSRNKIRHNIVSKLNNEEREIILKEIEDKNQENAKKLAKLKDLNLNSRKILTSLNDEDFQIAFFILIGNLPYSGAISKKSILNFKASLESEKPNFVMTFNESIEITITYDEVIASLAKNNIDEGFKFIIESPSIIDTPYFFFDGTKNTSNRNIKPEDYPLTIRNATPSDTFMVKDYFVKFRRAVIDWKMPSYLRNRWPVIVSKNGNIIYVPRYSKDFKISDDLNFFVKLD